jgi:hypothetical protein
MRVEELERELRAERPGPSQDFARRLDEWAADGFPRDRGLGPRVAGRRGPLGRAWDRLTSTPPRRILLPAGAVATVVVVAGVALSRPGDEPTSLTVPAQPSGEAAQKPETTTAQETAPAPATGGAAGAVAPESDEQFAPPPPDGAFDLAEPPGRDGAIARGEDDRIVDASARITLGADADQVQDVANEVVEVTDRYDGIVLDSEVTSDQAGARAAFELEIPFKHLDAALGDLSGLADVISRTEGGEDITAHAVRARRDLAQTLDRIRKARIAFIQADTREQRLVIKSQINSLKATAEAQLTELRGVKRQGRFATVDVEVTSNGPDSDDGNWGLDDAVDDAGDVLETIGGIALVSLAILLPLSLVATLIAFAISRGRRRSRDKALDD